ncbi:unnamed protein product [Mytilus coruscus]|uniref:Uncharacterized protein n=1 Tax=Mytilus coruscus TaxID=42192 RepID=A0A6J8B864_MYTCO|nr:unnamed protein product [Mytilus coruscus]
MKAYQCLFVLTAVCLKLCKGITEFRCTNKNSSEAQKVALKCPPNYYINVKEALYGRNQWDECRYFVGDCTEVFNVDDQCCGRNDCGLVVRKIYSIKCLAYVSFFRIIYECETAEESTCSVNGNTIKEPGKDISREQSNGLSPTSPDFVNPTSNSTAVSKAISVCMETQTYYSPLVIFNVQLDENCFHKKTYFHVQSLKKRFFIIVGSAVTVAFLLAAIIAAIFFLRKYQWHGEKQCLLELFVGLCKRHPPDGCEYPKETNVTMGDKSPSNEIQQVVTIETITNAGAININNKIKNPRPANQQLDTVSYNSITTYEKTNPHIADSVITDDPVYGEKVQNVQINNICYDSQSIHGMHSVHSTAEGIFTDV